MRPSDVDRMEREAVRRFGLRRTGRGATFGGFFMFREVTPTRFDDQGNVTEWAEATPWRPGMNAITNAGFDYLHSAGLGLATQIGTWYGGLIDNSGFTGVNVADTMASHSGWTEFANYSGANRPTWTPGTSTNGSMPGTGALTFNIGSGGGTLRGAFLTSGQVKGATTGLLYAHKADGAGRVIPASQAQQVFYTSVLTPAS